MGSDFLINLMANAGASVFSSSGTGSFGLKLQSVDRLAMRFCESIISDYLS